MITACNVALDRRGDVLQIFRHKRPLVNFNFVLFRVQSWAILIDELGL
ncbi:hypothetical protein IR120_02045 [Muribacter muris]|nr:hypothetical protein [Muribacter muris]MBF0784256.1 hypothetical protein [Muribacter muris]MBF0827006.1 hypothetical protein [Muribacter muris]